MELHKKYGNQVACISLSFDFYGGEGNDVEESRADVLKFLREQNATFDNVLSSTPDEKLYKIFSEQFKLPKSTNIPIVLVFSKDGKLARRFDNTGKIIGKHFTYEKDVEPLVAALVKE